METERAAGRLQNSIPKIQPTYDNEFKRDALDLYRTSMLPKKLENQQL